MERHRRRKEKSSAKAAHHTILTALHSVFCFVLLCIEIGSYYEVLAGLKLKRQMRVCLSNAGIKAVCYYAGSGEKKKKTSGCYLRCGKPMGQRGVGSANMQLETLMMDQHTFA